MITRGYVYSRCLPYPRLVTLTNTTPPTIDTETMTLTVYATRKPARLFGAAPTFVKPNALSPSQVWFDHRRSQNKPVRHAALVLDARKATPLRERYGRSSYEYSQGICRRSIRGQPCTSWWQSTPCKVWMRRDKSYRRKCFLSRDVIFVWWFQNIC